jgi:hypothetical protein
LLHAPDQSDDEALAATIDTMAAQLAKDIGAKAADVEVVFLLDGPMEVGMSLSCQRPG